MPGPAVTRIFCHLARASVRVPVADRGCPAGQRAALACRVAIPETEPVTERLQANICTGTSSRVRPGPGSPAVSLMKW
jgi:hypothetical protein